MPISSQTPIVGYVANGVTTTFTFPFVILSSDDLKVTVNNATITTGFSIAGVGDRDGGSVTFAAPPAAATPIILYREVALNRTTDYQENGDLLAAVLDDDFDRLWLAIQDQSVTRLRALQVPLDETVNPIPKASERALKVLGFNALGQPIALNRTDDGGATLALELLDTAPGKGAALVGYGSGTVKDALDALDFPALTSADLPIDDADLMLIRQGAGNKKLAISDLLSKIYAGDRLIFKPDANAVAFTKTGATTVSIRAGVKVDVGGKVIEFASATAVTMPALTAGEDYAIWCTPAGALVCNADPFSAPASAPVAGSRKIGGFHYGLVAPGTTPASGGFATSGFTGQGGSMIWTQAAVDRIAGINEFSLWDLAWRCKGQQRGMTLDPQKEVWHAIYFCSVNHITNGISRYNTDVASGTVLPRIPLVYGGDGSTNYGRLSQYECEEIAASFGLRLPTPDEFRSAAFGVTEGQSLGGAASTIPSTTRQPGYTSRIGIEQATGHEWVFARGNSSSGGTAFTAGPNRGDSYGNLFVTLLGGTRYDAANSGSRASRSVEVAWHSGWSVALRAAGDHLKHV